MILRRVLVANRGEIAVRILRTCRALGIETVLAVSDADRDVAARPAGRRRRSGSARPRPPPATSTSPPWCDAALAAGADAIHPGYGFLVREPAPGPACDAAGLVFIGPTAGQLEAVGDKLAARAPRDRGRPAGRRRAARSPAPAEAAELAAQIGWPVLVKAVGGGGGRGLRPVREPAGARRGGRAGDRRGRRGFRRPAGVPGAVRAARPPRRGAAARRRRSASSTWATGTARCSGATRS